jgi:hypothetical protein
VILPAALGCLIGAVIVLVVGWRRSLAEIALLGTSLSVYSLFSVLHALTLAPGARPGLSWLAMAIGFPVGLVAGLPLLAPPAAARRWVARHWRGWVIGWLAATVLGAVTLSSAPRG